MLRFVCPQQYLITGSPSQGVGGGLVTVAGVCRRLLSSVTLHCGPAGGFTHQAMTSCHLQSNYSSKVTLHGGPVVLRTVTATPCFNGNYAASPATTLLERKQ